MNDTLKVAGRIGAELGAAKAENDRLRAEVEALRVALLGIAQVNPAERCIEWAKSYASDGLSGTGSELYIRWLETFKEAEALRKDADRRATLSQQPEPTDTYTAVDMATAAAQGFRDGQAALVEAAQGALSEIQAALEDAYLNAYQECCGQAYLECCGSPLQAWSEADQKIMDRFAPHEKSLRHALAAPIAQTAPQGKFRMGDLVRKTSGSEWQGRICGTYSTPLTPEGYAVESEAHAGSVQIYPAKALEAVDD